MYKSNKKIAIEFFGYPGCGKSTISLLIFNYLTNNGYKVMEPKRKIDKEYITIVRYSVKIYYSLKAVIKYNKDLIKIIKKIFSLNKGIQAIKQSINILYTLSLYDTKKEISIIDEGIIQAITSATINSSIDDTMKLFNMIPKRIKQEIIFIYVDINPNICKNRIMQRTNGKSRIDKITNEEEILDFLKKLDTKFDKLKDNIDFKIINNSDNISETKINSLGTWITKILERKIYCE